VSKKQQFNMRKGLFLILLLALITNNVFSQTYSGGNGSANAPYLISSKADMEAMASAVNGGNNYAGMYFLLTTDLTDITTVIGDLNAHPFSGIFNGNNNTIELNITSNNYVGVFGMIVNSTVKNLNVTGQILSSPGRYYLGGICGWAGRSTIFNCHSSVTISTSTQFVGGICGVASSSTVSMCSNIGNITNSGTAAITGGICGENGSSIVTNCFNIGDVSATSSNSFSYAGGICGQDFGTVINCYNTGNLYSSASGYNNPTSSFNSAYATGISTINIISSSSTAAISNCFNANNTITCVSERGNKITGRISDRPGESAFYQRVFNCYALPTTLINGSTVSSSDNRSKEGADTPLSSFQSESWIKTNLGWDFDNVWEMSDMNSIYQGLPILRPQQSPPIIIGKSSIISNRNVTMKIKR